MRRRRDPRAHRERGASLLEAALVAPVFFLTVFGVFEIGLLVRSHIVVNAAVSSSVRSAAVLGNQTDADFTMLQTMAHGFGSTDPANIEMIVVYKADGGDDSVPAACINAAVVPPGQNCNRYDGDDFAKRYVEADGTRTDWWGCGASSIDDNWCPDDRQSALSDPGGPDHIGIYVRFRHQFVTGFLGSSTTVEVDQVQRIEPARN